MKLVFVAPNLDVGGVERQWSVLLPALMARGATAEVVTLDGEGRFFDELVSKGMTAKCLGVTGRLPIVGALRAARAIATVRPDVVMTAGASAHVVGHLASRQARAPHVVAIHTIQEGPMATRQRVFHRALAGRVAACTTVTQAQLPFASSLGFRPSATHVIPSGIDAPAIPAGQRDQVRAELGVGSEAFLALLVATLRPEKRAERFVEAVVRANQLDPRVRGVVAGSGPELDRVRDLCRESASVVASLGARTDIGELVHAADTVCLTSDAEALPLSLLEAMAGARPVVASDVGGVRDAVVDGETGVLVRSDDVAGFASAIAGLSADPELASRLGDAGRRRHLELFTTERMVDAHLELFEDVVGQHARSGGGVPRLAAES